MCGIAGFLGRFEPEQLHAMAAAIAHRGPDDSGTFLDPERGLGLAHKRLSILDTSAAGRQPMEHAGGRYRITFNGEIYNYRELRESLKAGGAVFRNDTDTEVLLALYAKEGVGMLSRLNGIFAFAIWDAERRELFLARDPLGVKPLYLAELADGVAFASELKALLKLHQLPKEINPRALLSHVGLLWSAGTDTALKDVRKVAPGEALVVAEGRVRRRWDYYTLPSGPPKEGVSDEDWVERLDATLAACVRRQLVSDVPVGAFLSGGLDSAAVVSYALRAGSRLPCFTIRSPADDARREGMEEDYPYAVKLAKHLGVELQVVDIGSEVAEHFESMVYALDEPQADTAPMNVYFISKLARSMGIRVLLSGVGGDDVFSGYRRHHALMLERYWAWLPRWVRAGFSSTARSLSVLRPSMRRIAKAFQYAHLAGDERIASYFLWAPTPYAKSLFSEDLQAALRAEDPVDILSGYLKTVPPSTGSLQRMLLLEQRYFLPDHNLNFTDKMSMLNGVEVRVPLIDVDLLALGAEMPASVKHRRGQGKWILRQVMEKYIPREIIYRPKTGFSLPVRSWLRRELVPLVDDVISADALRRRGLFNPVSVRRMVEADRAGKIDAAYPVLAMLCIELWCRKFLDGRGSGGSF